MKENWKKKPNRAFNKITGEKKNYPVLNFQCIFLEKNLKKTICAQSKITFCHSLFFHVDLSLCASLKPHKITQEASAGRKKRQTLKASGHLKCTQRGH